MERDALAREINQVCRLTGEFTLRSGRVAHTYFDKYQFESRPDILAAVAQHLAPLVPDGVTILAGLELGGIPVVTALSLETGLPASFLRKEPKTHGTCRYAEGPDLQNETVLLVEDVVSTGGAIIDQARMLRADQITVDRVLVVLDRETGGREGLAAEGIEMISLLTQSDLEDV
ncbi:MAG: orotate phosphoribosyltransferase [Pseudomonadota bacterium]